MALKRKFNKIELPIIHSETRALSDPEFLANKTVKLDMTRKMRGKGLEITFQIYNNDGHLVGQPRRMQLLKNYVQKMMRKRTDYVEDSFQIQCSDVVATVKPFLITRKNVSRAIRRNLRNTAKENILAFVKDKKYLEVCDSILTGELQKTLLPRLKKVYPLSLCEIRVIETKDVKNINQEFAKSESISEEVEEVEEEKTQAEEIEEELAKKAEVEDEADEDEE